MDEILSISISNNIEYEGKYNKYTEELVFTNIGYVYDKLGIEYRIDLKDLGLKEAEPSWVTIKRLLESDDFGY